MSRPSYVPRPLPAPTPPTPTFIYETDVATFNLTAANAGGDIVIDNQADYSGVLRLNISTDVPAGTKWHLDVIYGRNGGTQYTGGTSLVVLYGLDGETINVLKSIEDHQTILQVGDDVDVFLGGGRIQRGTVGGVPVSRLIGMSNRITYINTITAESPFSGAPNANGDATGTPTLTNYGVVHANLTIQAIGTRTNPSLPTAAPTFIVSGENTYFSALIP